MYPPASWCQTPALTPRHHAFARVRLLWDENSGSSPDTRKVPNLCAAQSSLDSMLDLIQAFQTCESTRKHQESPQSCRGRTGCNICYLNNRKCLIMGYMWLLSFHCICCLTFEKFCWLKLRGPSRIGLIFITWTVLWNGQNINHRLLKKRHCAPQKWQFNQVIMHNIKSGWLDKASKQDDLISIIIFRISNLDFCTYFDKFSSFNSWWMIQTSQIKQ